MQLHVAHSESDRAMQQRRGESIADHNYEFNVFYLKVVYYHAIPSCIPPHSRRKPLLESFTYRFKALLSTETL